MRDGSVDARFESELREHVPRVLGAVVRRSGDFAAAEDAVQDALLAAVVDWRRDGVPQNPGGWLFRVACRRLADHGEAEAARRRRETLVAAEAGDSLPPPEVAELEEFGEGPEVSDDTLTLFFLCAHPALTPPAAIALTLRAVGGLTTAEIAKSFLVQEATLAQRISRAKQTIQSSGVPFTLPGPAERAQRMDAVLHTLYLIFNEGYVGSVGSSLVRVELSDEALRLARLVHRLAPDHAEATGLLALLLLTDARRAARTGPVGELIPLHEQDRGLWKRDAIAEGTALVSEALALGCVGSYQVQAAIAALHDEAPSVKETDWPQILMLYGLLQRMSPNPLVTLNRAIALAMVHGPQAGLAELRVLDGDPRLAGSHRLDAVRAHLCELSGDLAAAIRHYRAAAARATNLAERTYLTTQAARLAHS